MVKKPNVHTTPVPETGQYKQGVKNATSSPDVYAVILGLDGQAMSFET